MKKVISVLSLALVLFISCEGPQGPPGLDGFDGTDAEAIGKVFDQVVNFGAADNFSITIPYPTTIEVFENDVVLVYRQAEVIKDSNNEDTDVWQLLPQNFFLDEGILQYNYDHTFFDVTLFLDGTFDLSILGDQFTKNQVFRIAVVPARMVQGKELSSLKFSEIENMLNTDTDQLLF